MLVTATNYSGLINSKMKIKIIKNRKRKKKTLPNNNRKIIKFIFKKSKSKSISIHVSCSNRFKSWIFFIENKTFIISKTKSLESKFIVNETFNLKI